MLQQMQVVLLTADLGEGLLLSLMVLASVCRTKGLFGSTEANTDTSMSYLAKSKTLYIFVGPSIFKCLHRVSSEFTFYIFLLFILFHLLLISEVVQWFNGSSSNMVVNYIILSSWDLTIHLIRAPASLHFTPHNSLDRQNAATGRSRGYLASSPLLSILGNSIIVPWKGPSTYSSVALLTNPENFQTKISLLSHYWPTWFFPLLECKILVDRDCPWFHICLSNA